MTLMGSGQVRKPTSSQPPVSEDEGFAPVAEEVSNDKDVHLVLDVVERVPFLLGIVQFAVTTVVL